MLAEWWALTSLSPFFPLCSVFGSSPCNQLSSECGRSSSDASSSIWMPGTAHWTVILISVAVSMQLEFFILPGCLFSLAHLELFGIYMFLSHWGSRTLCSYFSVLVKRILEAEIWGEFPSAVVFGCTSCRRSTLKLTLILKLLHTCRANAVLDCQYKRRSFCRGGCKFLKIWFVSENSN